MYYGRRRFFVVFHQLACPSSDHAIEEIGYGRSDYYESDYGGSDYYESDYGGSYCESDYNGSDYNGSKHDYYGAF
jgi:hypothetical protein